MSLRPPSSLSPPPPSVPGGSREAPGAPGGARPPVDLASNENPLGPSPKALEAILSELPRSHRYPDDGGRRLREALSERFGVAPEEVILGNGSTELVELLARTFLGREGWAVMAEQTFILYRIAVLAVNGNAREVPLREGRHDLPAMAAACDERTALVYIANPDNPTGTYVTAADLEEYFRRAPSSVITVLDEAYAEYMERPDYPSGLDLLLLGRRVVVLRTFSKAFGLAGLRIGFGLAPTDVISAMERIRTPFNTSRTAQAAALAALEDPGHLERSRALARQGREFLEAEFRRRRLLFVPSATNFILLEIGRDAEAVHQDLLRRGVITRPLGPYRFPRALRVTVGTTEENRRFLEALDEVLGHPRLFPS